MSQSWINIEGELVSLEETPLLLNELNLMPIFLRRFLEKKFTNEIVPTREEQTIYYQKFLKKFQEIILEFMHIMTQVMQSPILLQL